MADAHFIVIGGGHAAGQLTDSLRREGFAGRITVLSDEQLPPYQRPHLSKLYLAGRLAAEKLLYRPREFYARNNVDLRLGHRVQSIDRAARTVTLVNGECIGYDRLALCTGASVRKLPLPGADGDGVFYLRTVSDTDRIRNALETARNVVFIGGGFLGMEAAGVMATLGKRVTVLELQPRIMASAVAPVVSEFFRQAHTRHGVEIRTGTGVRRIHSNQGRVCGVETTDGLHVEADLVVISVGVAPNVELAIEAGLRCDDGICVDEFARTGDPDIFSAGDCTRHPNAWLGRELRLESVHNAVEQAKSAAASMCGRLMPYAQVPWFWSDQHEFRLQMVGLPAAEDEIVLRGDPATGSFAVLFFRDGRLSACHAVNRPADYMNCRRMLENHIDFSPRQAADRRFDPASLLPPKTRLAFQRRGRELTA